MGDQSFDAETYPRFKMALDRALDDSETKESLEEISESGLDIDVEKIRDDVLAVEDVVVERTATMRKGREAVEKRSEAIAAERMRRIRRSFRWQLLLVAAVLALIAIWLLPSPYRWLVAGFVGFAPLIPPYFLIVTSGSIFALQRAREDTEERFLESLETQTTVSVREAINRRLISFSTTFRLYDRRGLRQLSDPDREVSTTAIAELEGLVASLDSGSIGLSGPRGCGKTTLIRSFTEGRTMPFNRERIGLTASAPVKYDPREFVLHLFASLCEKVLGDRSKRLTRSGSSWSRARARRNVRLLGLAGLALLATGVVLYAEPGTVDRQTAGIVALILGAIATYGWFLFWLDSTALGAAINKRLEPVFDIGKKRSGGANDATEAAKGYLEQIRFQQSHDTGRTAEVSLPLGLSLGGSSSTTLARAPWTLPEAVEEFRRFAALLSDRFVVIGIDELDKMESDEAAREFLNNIKGVFGVSGCYFLVSVSEDAMSAFERRGLPLRDVFDSSFDEIQRIGYLDLSESRMVLESRVTGLTVPFQCLCHCLAGGLPRDLIRVTRELVHHYDVESEGKAKDCHLADLTARLIDTEWRGKLDGAIAAGRSSKDDRPWWLTRWLHTQEHTTAKADALRARSVELAEGSQLERTGGDSEAEVAARRIGTEMVAFNYYAATVLELFGGDSVSALLQHPKEATELDPDGAKIVETLAMSRQQFSVDPWLSWGMVDAARRAASLPPWPDIRPAQA